MPPSKRISLLALLICIAFQAAVSLWYYPKWKGELTESVISWDVSGYYFYLPGLFIYDDLNKVEWREDIYAKYGPGFDQTYLHESGNQVMKYSAGMALQYLPAFLAAHAYALLSPHHAASGFSRPYQLAIYLWSLLFAALGLYLLRRFLIGKLADGTVAGVLLLYVFGSNYLDYSTLNGAMSHNYLFTYYAALLLLSEGFYRKPSWKTAALIGSCIGMMTLIRPTELIAALIPLLYGIDNWPALKNRSFLLRREVGKYSLAAGLTLAIASIQLIYWQFVSGSFFVYSYQEQGFSWLAPHLYEGIFTYKSGWLVYSPIFILFFPGLFLLYRKERKLFWAISLHSLLFIYIAFAWDEWWYGASLGQRAMVQSYPLLALPFGLFLQWAWNAKFWQRAIARFSLIAFALICCTFNLWLTHHAHHGGLLEAGNMNRAYFWYILGKSNISIEGKKLLDTDELFSGERSNVSTLLTENFEDKAMTPDCPPLNGKAACLSGQSQEVISWELPASALQSSDEWLRFAATYFCPNKEWDIWRMHKMSIRLFQDDQLVWKRHIKVQRQMDHKETKEVYIDTSLPDREFNRMTFSLFPSGSEHALVLDDVRVEAFQAASK